MFFSEMLAAAVDLVWGTPLVILLMGGGSVLFMYSRVLPLTGFFHAFRLLAGKVKHHNKAQVQGQISHFQALTNALAATIGLGNIAGVAVAITQGGPGAVFWMWVAAVIGMNTKFFECTLAVMFRGQDFRGEVQGGPMYTIEKALPALVKPMAIFFAICGLIGTQAMFQANQLSAFFDMHYGVPRWSVGVVSAIFVATVIHGGVRRIGRVTAQVVPAMCLLYVLACMVILASNLEHIPGLFAQIFRQAFSGSAVAGGAMGYAMMEVLKVGVKRAAFSNEAGVGTAPMAHGNARTPEPVAEGFVAMLGPFFDTIIVCTMTALVILVAVPSGQLDDVAGITITSQAFDNAFPGVGIHILALAILLFAVSTMLGMANYNQKCWDYLFKGRWKMREAAFVVVFSAMLILGAVSDVADVVNFLDLGYGLMAFPNMIATLWLAPKVKVALSEYLKKYKV